MRTKLKAIGTETRDRYLANVVRCGVMYNTFANKPERTILLGNVVHIDSGNIVTDHLWMKVGKKLCDLKLKSGDTIKFNARVGTYKRFSRKHKIDYKLNRMTNIEVSYSDRELNEDELTSADPATFGEWKDIQELNRLKKEYSDDSQILEFDFEIKEFERLGELKRMFKKRYFNVSESERKE